MFKWLENLPWSFLIIMALLLGVVPVHPEPHLFEKIRFLINGTLTRWLDIFDLVMHSAPIILIVFKLMLKLKSKKKPGEFT
jgi:hypothetical protein